MTLVFTSMKIFPRLVFSAPKKTSILDPKTSEKGAENSEMEWMLHGRIAVYLKMFVQINLVWFRQPRSQLCAVHKTKQVSPKLGSFDREDDKLALEHGEVSSQIIKEKNGDEKKTSCWKYSVISMKVCTGGQKSLEKWHNELLLSRQQPTASLDRGRSLRYPLQPPILISGIEYRGCIFSTRYSLVTLYTDWTAGHRGNRDENKILSDANDSRLLDNFVEIFRPLLVVHRTFCRCTTDYRIAGLSHH